MAKGKRKIIIAVSLLVLAVIIGLGIYFFVGMNHKLPESKAVKDNVNTGKTVVDSSVTYQTMNGFGASGCWWSQEVGEWENSREIMQLLYGREKGIGLNIYRYNLGAGSKGDDHIQYENRSAEGFLKADGTYNFSADKNARNILAQAKEFAGDDLRVTLFCNSAPVSLTKNGRAYCSAVKSEEEPYETNLEAENYKAFADYCCKTAEFFLEQGYRVTDVSPVNEPQYAWRAWYNDDGSYSVNQEGCYYSKTECTELYNAMVERFENSQADKKGCKVSLFESGSAEGKGSSHTAYLDCILGKGIKYSSKNEKLREYFDTVSTHSYWSSAETKEKAAGYMLKKFPDLEVVCTEYCQMTNDRNTGVYDLIEKENGETNGMTIEYGVAMAQVILDDLTILNAKEWDWWTACSYGVYPDGLIYINADNHSDIQTSKRLWCLGNFSKFIDEGAVRLACSSGVEGLNCCAFKNKDSSTAVVYVNNTDNDLKTSLDTPSGYEVYTTSAELNLERTDSADVSRADITVPSKSVVTVIY